MLGYVSDVFTSVQGEGIRAGVRQTFIRFLGCNLSCNYCDTPQAQRMKGALVVGTRIYPNPVAVDFLLQHLDAGEAAITGGEPLLQVDYLGELCTALKKSGIGTYLETNGSLPGMLSKIIGLVDWVALDFKIPTATGRPALWHEHQKCLEIASARNVFIKMIINENLLPRELEKVCTIIEKINRKAVLVIQPIHGRVIPNLLDIQKKALQRLADVRIIPQLHKCLNLP